MVLVVCFQNNIIVKVFNCSLQTNLIFELSEVHSQFLESGSTGLQLYWDDKKVVILLKLFLLTQSEHCNAGSIILDKNDKNINAPYQFL